MNEKKQDGSITFKIGKGALFPNNRRPDITVGGGEELSPPRKGGGNTSYLQHPATRGSAYQERKRDSTKSKMK